MILFHDLSEEEQAKAIAAMDRARIDILWRKIPAIERLLADATGERRRKLLDKLRETRAELHDLTAEDPHR